MLRDKLEGLHLHCTLCPYCNPSNSSDWAVDSSATYLATLALCEPYTASDSVLIGDSIGLFIANIDSFILTSLLTPLLFTNVLHVPTMSKNLISISTLCADNHINVLFFYSFFQVQDRHTGVTIVCGQRKDDVYFWLKSIPLWSSTLVLSSSVRSSFFAISI